MYNIVYVIVQSSEGVQKEMCYCCFAAMLCTLGFLPIFSSDPFIVAPTRKIEYEQSDIIFPDSIRDQQQIYKPEISNSPCFDQTTFCEHTGSYPFGLIESSLRDEEQYKYIFGIDEGDVVISDRLNEEEFVCASKSHLIFPKVAMNKRNEWKYIVNSGAQKQQGIRVEQCQREGSPCKVLSRAIYKTSCKQKYTFRRLLSISYNGTLELDSFLLPTACCCSFKPKINFNP